MGDDKLAVCCTVCCSLIGILGLMLITAAFILAKRPQSNFECYNQWAVAVDAKECSPVARKIISLGGNIADVAVASLLCMGVVWPHVMGIGGGFLAVHYNQSGKKSGVLISREMAPSNIPYVIPTDGLGAGAVAVPGAVSGYSELHTKLAGKLQWKELFDPAIDLALSGFPVSSVLGRALSEASQMIQDRPDMREVFWRKEFNRVFKEGEKLLQEGLAAILIELAKQGTDYFYTGNLAKAIVAKVGPDVINADDLKSYKAEWKPSLTAPLGGGDLQLHTAPPPGSGAIVARALQIIKGYDPKDPRNVTCHRLVEALKHALAQLPELGDTPAMDKVSSPKLELLESDSSSS
ncbi:glutathione hydrolase 1 proenzyme-like [Ixodes scapularis]|uniref:glutathione hydrolase 1 proenzyme-like n=1 Tax=Ixodes scapularis TaxID=6945 RepID=UPI001C38DFB7|nr:glutathione hydrolase 1 proenzyme-like [Ixodes scapularis]